MNKTYHIFRIFSRWIEIIHREGRIQKLAHFQSCELNIYEHCLSHVQVFPATCNLISQTNRNCKIFVPTFVTFSFAPVNFQERANVKVKKTKNPYSFLLHSQKVGGQSFRDIHTFVCIQAGRGWLKTHKLTVS